MIFIDCSILLIRQQRNHRRCKRPSRGCSGHPITTMVQRPARVASWPPITATTTFVHGRTHALRAHVRARCAMDMLRALRSKHTDLLQENTDMLPCAYPVYSRKHDQILSCACACAVWSMCTSMPAEALSYALGSIHTCYQEHMSMLCKHDHMV